MPRAALALLLSSLAAHLLLGRWVNSPWLLPDLTLVGLAIALARAPDHRPLLLIVAALGVALLDAPSAAVAYAAVGAAYWWAAGHWDLQSPAVGAVLIMAAEVALVAVWCWQDHPVASWELAGSVAAKVVLTTGWWRLLRWWMPAEA